MTQAASFSPARIVPNLSHAFGGVWRLTFRRMLVPGHWLMLGIGLAVLALLFIGGVHGGDAARFLDWTTDFYVTFLVPVVAFMAAAGTMRDEMKSGTVDYVLTRPLPRPAFVGFKFVAQTICLQIDFLVAFALVMVFAVTREVPNLPWVATKLLFGQVMMITAFSAFGFLSGALSARYIVIGLAYGGIIEVGVGQIPTQIGRLSMTQQMRDLLAILLGRVEAHAASPSLAGSTVIVLVFTAVMLAATAVIFAWRELTGPGDA